MKPMKPMKSTLEQFNQYLLDLQCSEIEENENMSKWFNYHYADKISFSEYQGFYDIIWFSGNSSTTAYSKGDQKKYLPNNIQQCCENNCENEESCDCEYEGQGLSWFIDIILAHPDKIRSLTFTGTDSGCNGLREWSFNRLLENDVVFPNLSEFKVQLHEVGDHNLNVISDDNATEDHTHVTQLLAKMPNVVSIELPTTPDKDFFSMQFPSLRSIKVQACYDSNNFIQNLANSPLLSKISLDFTDVWHDDELSYVNPKDKELGNKLLKKQEMIDNADDPKAAKRAEEYKLLKAAGFSEEEIALALDNPSREETLRLLKIISEDEEELNDTMAYYDSIDKWDENGEAYPEEELSFEDEYQPSKTYQKRTSVEDYTALFQSKYMTDKFHFKLRESYLAEDELFALQNANKNIQFLHIPTQGDYYISHRMQDKDLWLG